MQLRVQRLIESIHREHACPRLLIDLTRDGVVCPDFVREKWGERLVIDLDPSYPLNLQFNAAGVHVDLSFGGHVSRCTFPYAAIYMIADRATGKGAFFEEHAPASVLRERGLVPAAKRDADAPAPTSSARERAAGESRRRRRRPKADEAASTEEASTEEAPAEAPVEAPAEAPRIIGLAAVPAAADSEPDDDAADEAGDEEADASADASADRDVSEETEPVAARRRAIFTVIDGGK